MFLFIIFLEQYVFFTTSPKAEKISYHKFLEGSGGLVYLADKSLFMLWNKTNVQIINVHNSILDLFD